jgi:hypothetical protein
VARSLWAKTSKQWRRVEFPEVDYRQSKIQWQRTMIIVAWLLARASIIGLLLTCSEWRLFACTVESV